ASRGSSPLRSLTKLHCDDHCLRDSVSDHPDAQSFGQAHRDQHAAGSTQSDRNEPRLHTRHSDIDGDAPVADDADDAATAVDHSSGGLWAQSVIRRSAATIHARAEAVGSTSTVTLAAKPPYRRDRPLEARWVGSRTVRRDPFGRERNTAAGLPVKPMWA